MIKLSCRETLERPWHQVARHNLPRLLSQLVSRKTKEETSKRAKIEKTPKI